MVDGDGLENRCAKAPGVRIPLSPPFFFWFKRKASRPTLCCSEQINIFSFGMEKYPRGRRGSPAKGVVRDERSEGSNPSFSAKQKPCNRNGYRVFHVFSAYQSALIAGFKLYMLK